MMVLDLFGVLALSMFIQCNAFSPRTMPGFVRGALKLQSSSETDLLQEVSKSTPAGSVVVIKYGGHAMENEEAKAGFCKDVGALCRAGVLPIIVHGGGPQIKQMLATLNIESKFVDGLRVTDKKVMEVAQMVLCGSINKEIVGRISGQEGVRGAVGLCGLDSKLVQAKVKDPALGLVVSRSLRF